MLPQCTLSICAAILKVAGVCLTLLLARGVLGFLHMLLILPLYDPLRKLPGPKAAALENHFQLLMDPSCSTATHEDWQKQFGKTFRFHGFGKHDYRLMSFDFRVISHVLNSSTYEKPWQTRALLARLIGRGIFSREGSEHRFQRRLIGPAFTLQSVRAMTPVFLDKAQQMCDRWHSVISERLNPNIQPTEPPPAYAPVAAVNEKPVGIAIDVAHWTSRASFDVIGLTGFDYNFKALEDESEQVYGAYRRMFDVASKGPPFRGILELYFPIIRTLWPDQGTKVTNESLRIIDRAGKKLVAAKRAIVMADSSKTEYQQKDILSLLIKANLSNDPSKRLSDADLLDQCSTLLLAGSDSISLALAWGLHLLSLNPDIQNRLRDEIISIINNHEPASVIPDKDSSPRATPPPTYNSATPPLLDVWDKIEASPYLDAVVRETLRLCPPVHATIRVATTDDQIPVSHPVTLQDGTVVEKGSSISIRKGSYIHIPIEGLNLSTEIWGLDALEFKPDRWTSLPPNARSPTYPGVANVMTFGLGPHSCLGYKFCINQMKAFFSTILPQFIFEPAAEIAKFNGILTRPYIANKWELGTQLPLLVGRYNGQL